MINIEIGPVFCKFQRPIDANLITALRKQLRYRPDGYKFAYLYKRKQWDGYNHLLNGTDYTFRTGLLKRVTHYLDSVQIEYKLLGTLPKITPVCKQLAAIKLNGTPHPYQIEAAECTEPHSHCMVVSSTGSGKTWMMALMLKKYQTVSLIIVNTRTLLDQTFDFMDKIVPGGVGIVGSGEFTLKDVTIATIQSISSILGVGKKQKATGKAPELRAWLSTVQLFIFDEAHGADSHSVNGVCELVNAAKYIGLTATPYVWSTDEEASESLQIEANFGQVAIDTRDKVDFIKLGVNVPLFVRMVEAPTVKAYEDFSPSKYGQYEQLSYKDIVDTQVLDNPERTEFIADQVRELVNMGKSVYIYYQRLDYGKQLAEAMDDLVTATLTGSTPSDERKEILQALTKKELLVVISDIGAYGLDVPSLNALVLAYPSKDARQLIGRVVRSFPGKDVGLVIDIVDNVPMLHNHADFRRSQYIAQNAIVLG